MSKKMYSQVTPVRYLPGWFPGAGFKGLAKQWRISTRGILERPWAAMMEKYVRFIDFPSRYEDTSEIWLMQLKGTALPSYCTKLLDSIGGAGCEPGSELVIKETSAVIYAGPSAPFSFSDSFLRSRIPV